MINLFSLSISRKIPAIIVSVGVVAVSMTGAFAYFESKNAVEKEANSKLTAVLDDRAEGLSHWLKSIDGDLSVQAQNPVILEALAAFKQGWINLGKDQGKKLQALYIDRNPHPTGEKEKLDAAKDGSIYSMVHAKYHPYLRAFLRDRGYYDIFLFDPKGNLVYTVFKELDYATNLVSGKWADTDLGKAFKAARDNPKKGSKNFFDFKAYAPSHGAPASFISTPLLDKDGKFQGVLAFQMPIGALDELMQQKAGLGETGETYLMGGDKLMRSDSRFSKESTILKTKIDTPQVNLALKGENGLMISHDHHGMSVVAAYKPVKFHNVTWAVIAEQDYAEAFAGVISMRNQLLVGSVIGIALVLVIGVFFGRSLSRPITEINRAMTILAQGDHSVEIQGVDRTDEIGDMAGSVLVFKKNSIKNKEAEAQKEKERLEKEEKRALMDKITAEFSVNIEEIVNTVTSASAQLNSTSQAMSGIAEETSSQSSAVSAASEQAATNVQTVAAASEEMSHSIAEINQRVNDASEAARQAVTEVEKTGLQIENLASTANKISDVISMISDIADQTNLLALNATIESARAGEAGKGFAVVANEVKGLAGQTAKATEEIVAQINEIQSATQQAVVSMGDIGKVIRRVDETSASIAAAMEEQGAATQEIARNVQEAASGTEEVNRNIAGVSQASQEAGAASGQVMSSAGELFKQSERLKEEVSRFISQVSTG